MYSIIKAKTEAIGLIEELASRIWADVYKEILSKDQIEYMYKMMYSPENLLKQMQEWNHQFFIIFSREKACGYFSIEKTSANVYNFQKIYALQEERGKGIGRFMIEHGIEYIKKIHPGPFSIELYVNRYNPAVGFYKHMGLKELGTRDHPIGHGYFMNDYIMGMDILND